MELLGVSCYAFHVNKTVLISFILLSAASAVFAQTIPTVPFPIPALRETDSVTIYGDFREQFSGRSENRAEMVRTRMSEFSKTRTFPVGTDGGFLTAVVVDKRVERVLSALLMDGWYQNLGEYELFKEYIDGRKCYSYRHPLLGIEFTFGLEKPDDTILAQIDITYAEEPDTRSEVRTHYLDNFVVRIYRAENVVSPGLSEITYDEALIAATLIGDRFQWLWGIHNAEEILFRLSDR